MPRPEGDSSREVPLPTLYTISSSIRMSRGGQRFFLGESEDEWGDTDRSNLWHSRLNHYNIRPPCWATRRSAVFGSRRDDRGAVERAQRETRLALLSASSRYVLTYDSSQSFWM